MKVGDKWLSLNALRAFDATGRHLNMSRAAEELSITQSAISHQIRQLERALEIDLFFRSSRNLCLTPAGIRLLASVQRSFDDIAATILSVNEDLVHGELRVAVTSGFTYFWLMDRLPKFLAKFPGLTLHCQRFSAESNELPIQIDIAIIQDAYRFPGRGVELLSDLDLFPVCARSILPDAKKLKPVDLKNYTLIHEDDGKMWASWFIASGVAQTPAQRDIYMGSQIAALALAEKGLGFALNERNFGARVDKNSVLVCPPNITHEIHRSCYLVKHLEKRMSVAACEFEKWLRSEIRNTIA